MARKFRIHGGDELKAFAFVSGAVLLLVTAYAVSRFSTSPKRVGAAPYSCSEGITVLIPTRAPTPTSVPPTSIPTPTPPACKSCTTDKECSLDLTCQDATGPAGGVYSASVSYVTPPTINDKNSLLDYNSETRTYRQPNRKIYIGDPWRIVNQTSRTVTYRVVTNTSAKYTPTNLWVYVYYISPNSQITPPVFDPQYPVFTKNLGVLNANYTGVVTLKLPSCGRYQVDFASGKNGVNVVASKGTVYVSGSGPLACKTETGYFWGDNNLRFDCNPGCCKTPWQPTATVKR